MHSWRQCCIKSLDMALGMWYTGIYYAKSIAGYVGIVWSFYGNVRVLIVRTWFWSPV